jgi:Protein of unknown function (DUF3828)
MISRRTFVLAAAGSAFAGAAHPADASAVAFVAAIYNAYKGKDANGISLDGERAIRRYFEPTLGALLIKDQKDSARRNEVGTLDFDPFVDAQDWDVAAFDVSVNDTAPGKASATVKFANDGKPNVVLLDLVKIKNDWRINDITWQHDGKPETLRGLFRH